MRRNVSIVISALALIAGGVIQGNIVSRWRQPEEMTNSFASLNTLSTAIGAWEGRDFDVPDDQLKTAEVMGCLARRYVNRVDGKTINVLLFWGRPGPVALHPPTVCFPSTGLVLDAPPTRAVVQSEGISAEFLNGVFSKLVAGVPVRLHTYWTWHGRSGWQAPDNPRVSFA